MIVRRFGARDWETRRAGTDAGLSARDAALAEDGGARLVGERHAQVLVTAAGFAVVRVPDTSASADESVWTDGTDRPTADDRGRSSLVTACVQLAPAGFVCLGKYLAGPSGVYVGDAGAWSQQYVYEETKKTSPIARISPWVRNDVVGENPADRRGDKRDQQPGSPLSRIAFVVEGGANGLQRRIEVFGRLALRRFGFGHGKQRGDQCTLYRVHRLRRVRGRRVRRGRHRQPGGACVSLGVGEVDYQLYGALDESDHAHRASGASRVAGQHVVAGEGAQPGEPVGAPPLRQSQVVCRDHRLVPGVDGHRRVGGSPVELGVALAQHRECVLIAAQPDVQAVFFDPPVLTSAGGPLAPSRHPRW